MLLSIPPHLEKNSEQNTIVSVSVVRDVVPKFFYPMPPNTVTRNLLVLKDAVLLTCPIELVGDLSCVSLVYGDIMKD
jgi:hypothetical protein